MIISHWSQENLLQATEGLRNQGVAAKHTLYIKCKNNQHKAGVGALFLKSNSHY